MEVAVVVTSMIIMNNDNIFIITCYNALTSKFLLTKLYKE